MMTCKNCNNQYHHGCRTVIIGDLVEVKENLKFLINLFSHYQDLSVRNNLKQYIKGLETEMASIYSNLRKIKEKVDNAIEKDLFQDYEALKQEIKK